MSAGITARHRRFLLALRQYLLVFLLIAFVLTCCMVLFLNTLTASTGVALTEANVERAAKVTFLNVVLLSALFTAADALRRRWLVDRPARIITAAAEQMMKGDFSVRVPPMRGVDADSGFGLIASYFNLMAGELSGMETLRTDFIANVSHELKTPLAAIQNYSTLLAQPNLPEAERIEYARAACDTARRLASLITNILRLNKLENQQVYPNAETYDLGEQLCECLLNFEHAWEEKSLEIETEIEPDVHVRTDAELLSLVWNNLLSNAVKFTPPRGRISVSLRSDGPDAVVTVTDTGCGIAPELGRHIFEKFYQGDPSHATQGNGLGLALVKRVIDIVDGEISVRSEVGRGSTFLVRLRKHQGDHTA